MYRGGGQQAAAARYTASVRHNSIHNHWVKNTKENTTLQLDLLHGVTPHCESRNGNSKTTVVVVCARCSNSNYSEQHVKLWCSVCKTSLCPSKGQREVWPFASQFDSSVTFQFLLDLKLARLTFRRDQISTLKSIKSTLPRLCSQPFSVISPRWEKV